MRVSVIERPCLSITGIALTLAISVSTLLFPSRAMAEKFLINTKEPGSPVTVAYLNETEIGRAILAYLLCEDFDCAQALQDVIKIGSEAVSPFIQLLLYGAPPEVAAQVSRNTSSIVRSRAITALGELGDARALSPLIAFLQDSDPLIRARAAEAIAKLDGEASLSALLPLLKDPDQLVRETTASALGKLKRHEALLPLRRAARAELKPHVKQAMDAAIEEIGQSEGGSM